MIQRGLGSSETGAGAVQVWFRFRDESKRNPRVLISVRSAGPCESLYQAGYGSNRKSHNFLETADFLDF